MKKILNTENSTEKLKNNLEDWCKLTRNEFLLNEWNDIKNKKRPSEVTVGSDYRASWICSKCNNEWETKVSHRAQQNSGCPYCSTPPKKLKKGYNDLLSYCKNNLLLYLIDEWDKEKNIKLMDEYFPMSNYKAWWKCPFNHSYYMLINHRTGSKKSTCPICNKEKKTSFSEQAILYYLKKHFDQVDNCNKDIGEELDIYIPKIKTAIEYDGHDWHRNTEIKEKRKNLLCKKNNIKLIRIREGNLIKYTDCVCINRKNYSNIETLNDTILELLEIIDIKDNDINVIRDCGKIYSNYIFLKKQNSLMKKYPEIAKELDKSLNGNINADSISCYSNKILWWKCKSGHIYKSSVNHRTKSGRGCPICVNQKIVPGINDIKSYCIKNGMDYIINEWDYEKNSSNGIYITSLSTGSIVRVWWRCSKCNYEWQSCPNNRIKKKHRCPNCSKNTTPLNSVKVINADTGEIYDSIAAAGRATGIRNTGISSCCRGVQKTAGGYNWKYLEEKNKII